LALRGWRVALLTSFAFCLSASRFIDTPDAAVRGASAGAWKAAETNERAAI
jgi:hypothetical protein